MALFVISFWLMLMYEGAFVEAMFAVVILVPVFLAIIKYISKIQLGCKWTAGAIQVIAGKSIKITTVLENMSVFPINRVEMIFQITDLAGNRQQYTMITNIMAFTERKCTMEISPNFGGMVEVKLVKVKIFDILGLTSTTKKIGSKLNISVIPETEKLAVELIQTQKVIAMEGDVYSNNFPGTDRAQIFDVRQYNEGDNIKDIHWKLSLKTDDFVVKKYSLPVCNETNLFVDFAIVPQQKATSEGVDKFYSFVFSLIEEIEITGEKINIFTFDAQGNVMRVNDRRELLQITEGCGYVNHVCETFAQVIGKGRNILVSSRLQSGDMKNFTGLSDYYTDLETELSDETELLVEEAKIISVDITEKAETVKTFVDMGEELYINNDNEDILLYTTIARILIILLGSYVPVSVLLDTIVFEVSPMMMLFYAALATGLMCISLLIKKTPYKVLYVLGILVFVFLFIGVNDILTGIRYFINAFGNHMSIVHVPNEGAVFGLTEFYPYEIRSFLSYITFVVAIVLFIFTWKSITVIIHLLLTVPLVIVCFIYGCVPSGISTMLYVVYLFMVFAYGVTYGNIIRNEKNVLKKAFYESTLNLGAICSFIVAAIAIFIMIIDLSKGYERPKTLVEIKASINEFLEEANVKKPDEDDDSAVGGMNKGKLGQVDKVEFDGETRLKVSVSGNVEFPLYVKGYVGSTYTGQSWNVIGDNNNAIIETRLRENDLTFNDIYNVPYKLMEFEAADKTQMTIEPVKYANMIVATTDEDDSTYYIPYGAYFDKEVIEKDGIIKENAVDSQVYSVYQLTRPDNIIKTNGNIYAYSESVYSDAIDIYSENNYYYDGYYLLADELPDVYYYNNQWVDLLKGNANTNGYEVYVHCIRNYLKENFEYSLEPGKLKEDEDFLEKFMNERKGYCSHFATAATIMFRMYGIPARYVEGYFVHPDSDELKEYNDTGTTIIDVDDSYAHAWTEIYIDGYGWMPVEVTPGYDSPNYYAIDESMLEEMTTRPVNRPNNDQDSNQEKPDEKETTTKKEEQTTTKADNNVDNNAVRLDYDMIMRWAVVIILIGIITFILGRKSYKDKKIDDIVDGDDYSKAVRALEREFIRALELAKVAFSLNVTRTRLAKEVSEYIEEYMKDKEKAKYNKDEFEAELLQMYYIFDKASYDNIMISEAEKMTAAKTVFLAIRYVYQVQKWYQKLDTKYIKCLYLRRK